MLVVQREQRKMTDDDSWQLIAGGAASGKPIRLKLGTGLVRYISFLNGGQGHDPESRLMHSRNGPISLSWGSGMVASERPTEVKRS